MVVSLKAVDWRLILEWIVKKEIGWEYVDWIHLALFRDQWRALVNTVMKLRVRGKVGNFLTSCVTVSFSRRTLHH
jgi:hypothetical protein